MHLTGAPIFEIGIIMYEFLRKLPLFADLSDDDLENLCLDAEEIEVAEGEELFAEGSSGDHAYVIQAGEFDIIKQVHGQEILLAVRRAGEVIGEMALLQRAPRMASARSRNKAQVLSIGFEQLDHLINKNPNVARTMLQTITSRWRATQAMLRRSEKMAQLGSLAAGMAHELNNPATAALRGAEQLRGIFEVAQNNFLSLDELELSKEQLDYLINFSEEIQLAASSPSDLTALIRSDKESEVEEWLENHHFVNSWEQAPDLVNLLIDVNRLNKIAKRYSPKQLPHIILWITNTYSVLSLIQEIGEGARRISDIVNALKSYSYLDQAPTQEVNIHDGIDNTLILLRNKLKQGIVVRREYAENLPKINAYGSELNQVWTNLIDNAVDAMEGKGELIIRTKQEGKWVSVEIIDNGEGIPLEMQKSIFDPYFTTKPRGKGTGLGLDISRKIITDKHLGEIKLISKPGETKFIVKIPLNFEEL